RGHDSGDAEEAAVVRVLIADDSRVFLDAAREVVRSTAGFEEVAAATSGEAAVRLATATRPDLVLLAVRMPGMGGIEAAHRIHGELPEAVLVLVTADSGAELAGRDAAGVASEIVDKLALRPSTLRELWRRHRPEGERHPVQGGGPGRAPPPLGPHGAPPPALAPGVAA